MDTHPSSKLRPAGRFSRERDRTGLELVVRKIRVKRTR